MTHSTVGSDPERILPNRRMKTSTAMRTSIQEDPQWTPLPISQQELLLSHTLPVGQTFRWVETSKDTFTGIIGSRAYQLEQQEDGIQFRVIASEEGCKGNACSDGEKQLEQLNEYFQLNLKLSDFIEHWSKCDERFNAVKEYYPGRFSTLSQELFPVRKF